MTAIQEAIKKALEHQFSLQHPDGYWWYTLESNESINAEAIFLMHFLSLRDQEIESGLVNRIIEKRNRDGTWSLYHGGPSDLSATVECYWAIKLVRPEVAAGLTKTRDYILTMGGLTHARVFTKIHLAMFGLVPWTACPIMPANLIMMPSWAPVNIYEFSSWARECIVPLLVILNKKPVRPLTCHREPPAAGGGRCGDPVSAVSTFNLDELFAQPESERNWEYKTDKWFLSWENFFVRIDGILKKIPGLPFNGQAIKKCEEWICEHAKKTEDIYPGLLYNAIALSTIGYSNGDQPLGKILNALQSFQIKYSTVLPSAAFPNQRTNVPTYQRTILQQCCISPLWDTPWQITALLESETSPSDPRLVRAGRWLISKQITKTHGDWKVKNPDAEPGGWSFEFKNEYFPDVDDTIQVLHVLNRLDIPEKKPSIERGLRWLVSMQNGDGGWAAFDRNNNLALLNKIPFADHGACLDQSSPDITGRAVSLLTDIDPPKYRIAIEKGVDHLRESQELFGGWRGRWGINFIYGTWCALTALSRTSHCNVEEYGKHMTSVLRGMKWLISIQHKDGGWSESPETYRTGEYMPYPNSEGSVPSQTAWALMGLIAAWNLVPLGSDPMLDNSISKGINFLTKKIGHGGVWDEPEHTGTGFPNHFYLKYHGYSHYFPLLALAKYSNSKSGED